MKEIKEPNLLCTYDEWLIEKNRGRKLSDTIKPLSEGAARGMCLGLDMLRYEIFGRPYQTNISNQDRLWCDWYDKKVKLENIEHLYTDYTHNITYLYGQLDGKNHKLRQKIYTDIGKLQCKIIKLKEELNKL